MKVTFPPSHPKHGGESWEYAQIERVVEELGVNQSHLSTSTKDGPWEPSKGKFKGHTFERLGRPEYPEDMWLTFPCPACERKLLPLEVPQEGGDDYTSLNFYALTVVLVRIQLHISSRTIFGQDPNKLYMYKLFSEGLRISCTYNLFLRAARISCTYNLFLEGSMRLAPPVGPEE